MSQAEEPSPSERPMRLRYAAVSDLGRHRKDNQDSGYASSHLIMVADGVGGAAFGDVASSTAVHLMRRVEEPPASEAEGEEMLTVLAGAVHRVHDKLSEMVEQDTELDGTSTTLTAALFDGSRFGFAHVGDSRAYLWRRGELKQVTDDHTFVQTLIDEGRITEEESRSHPHRNIILRAVDAVHESEPDLFHIQAEVGDRVVLCSDGCSGALTDAQMAAIISEGSIDSITVELVQAALDNGSTDNVTVVAAEVVPADTVDDPESAAAGVGPMLVGAASQQPRRGVLARTLFRGRQHDTGELDAVPDSGAPASTEPVDPEELRYAPRAPHRHARLRRALWVVVPLLALVIAAFVGYRWTQQQYYVAPDGPQVAIFRGVQVDVPGLDLSDVYETDTLRVADLSDYNSKLVDEGIVASSLTDARKIVANLNQETAQEQAAQPTPTAKPTAKPGTTPTTRPTATPTTKPTARTQG